MSARLTSTTQYALHPLTEHFLRGVNSCDAIHTAHKNRRATSSYYCFVTRAFIMNQLHCKLLKSPR